MIRFETIFHIINKGWDEFDAGEIAGEVLDISKITNNMYIYCDPTKRVERDVEIRKETINRPRDLFENYETVIHVFNDNVSRHEAAEVAGALFDGAKMEPGMTISCESPEMEEAEEKEYKFLCRGKA